MADLWPAYIARLHQILTLKALGLSLKQIREALGSDGLAIGEILALQALHLEQDIRSARRRLLQVQNARQHCAQTGIVPADVLLGLAHDLTPDRPPELAELRALIEPLARQGGVVDEVRDALRTCSGGDGSALEIQIGDPLDDAAILAVEAEPGFSRAAAMADRWLVLAALLDLPTGDAKGAAALCDLSAQLAAALLLAALSSTAEAGERTIYTGVTLLDPVAEPKVQRFVRMLHEAGVPLTIGTDTNNPFVAPGASVAREMELHVAAGMPAWAALRMATASAARALEIDDRTGRLEPGMEADIVFLEADPSVDIVALTMVVGVVENGRFHQPNDLNAAALAHVHHYGPSLLHAAW